MNRVYYMILLVLICNSIHLNSFARSTKSVAILAASKGTHATHITVSWKKMPGIRVYAIWRAPKKKGNFKKIAEVNDTTEFIDAVIEPGYEYWYKVFPASAQFSRYYGALAAGHSKIKPMKGYKFKSLMKKFKRSKPKVTSANEKKKRKEHLSLLKKYYLNYFKLSIAYYFADYFIKRGNLIVVTHFQNYSFLHKTNEILIKHPDNKYQIIFYTNKFFRLLKEAQDLSLMKRLMNNAIMFCIYKGEKRVQFKNGRVKYIPYYEAAGMITQYFKYYKQWKKNTIIFGTSRDELKEKIKKVRQSKNI